MSFGPLFVAPATHPHSRRILDLLKRHGVETRTFSDDELPPELLQPAVRIRIVVCFDSGGNYPGNYLRVLQSPDVAPGNRCQFVVPGWTTPIKLHQRVAVRPITSQEYDDKRFGQAVHAMYRDITGVRIPREVVTVPPAVGGGFHLPRDFAKGDERRAAL